MWIIATAALDVTACVSDCGGGTLSYIYTVLSRASADTRPIREFRCIRQDANTRRHRTCTTTRVQKSIAKSPSPSQSIKNLQQKASELQGTPCKRTSCLRKSMVTFVRASTRPGTPASPVFLTSHPGTVSRGHPKASGGC